MESRKLLIVESLQLLRRFIHVKNATIWYTSSVKNEEQSLVALCFQSWLNTNEENCIGDHRAAERGASASLKNMKRGVTSSHSRSLGLPRNGSLSSVSRWVRRQGLLPVPTVYGYTSFTAWHYIRLSSTFNRDSNVKSSHIIPLSRKRRSFLECKSYMKSAVLKST